MAEEMQFLCKTRSQQSAKGDCSLQGSEKGLGMVVLGSSPDLVDVGQQWKPPTSMHNGGCGLQAGGQAGGKNGLHSEDFKQKQRSAINETHRMW